METAIAFGTFDGLHKGHRAVLKETLAFKSVAVTFDFPPKFSNGGDNLLMLPEKKRDALKKYGIKTVKSFDFNAIKDIEASKFLDAVIKEFSPGLISCGFNFRFGKGAAGNTGFLNDYCYKHGIRLCVVPPVCSEGEAISSTAIRNLIEKGEVEKANSLLFEDFSFSEKIIHGDARGRTLGFPTANQLYPDLLVKPKFGVYETEAEIDGASYRAITNIGIRPTYKTDKVFAETFLIDAYGDFYEKEMTVKLKRFIRPEIKFSSEKALTEQIKKDITEVKL